MSLIFSFSQGSGQAVAIRVTVNRCAFYNCRFLGWQVLNSLIWILYLHYGRQYLKDCYIEGSVDFILGISTALLEHCHSQCKSAGFITAQRRKSSQESTGYVFLICVITGNGGSSYSYLGHPWGPFGRVVFAYTYMDQCIKHVGWNNWENLQKREMLAFMSTDVMAQAVVNQNGLLGPGRMLSNHPSCHHHQQIGRSTLAVTVSNSLSLSIFLLHPIYRVENFSNGKWQVKLKKPELKCHANIKSNSQKYLVRNELALKPATYSARIFTDIPLYETPGALFDEYLKDKPRIFNAMFPDKHRSEQLNQDEWRIQMLPLKLLVLTVWPVVDLRLRCKSRGRDYPPEVPRDITKVLELDITRWELQGLDNVVDPSHFALIVKGTLYPDRRGNKSRLRGHLEMNISFVLPPALAFVPENIRNSLGKGVMTKLVESMKQKVDGSLVADYSKFKRERSDKRV
ncbi:hypothetical protein CRYUN_Cryun15aG0036600 [Craigia yunnanensis]